MACLCRLLLTTLLTATALSSSNLDWLSEKEAAGYDPTLHPNQLNLSEPSTIPTVVNISFYVEAIGDFQIKSMVQDYSIDIYFVEQWRDYRLWHELPTCMLYNDWLQVRRFWRPDVYLANSKSATYNEVTVPNHVLQVCPHARIRFSTRISAKIACHMDLKYYPFDRQTCSLRLLTYGHNASQVLLRWEAHQPITVSEQNSDADLKLNHSEWLYCDGTFSMGNYSCLVARFHFERVISQHILQIFAPTFAIVCISWISFWIDPLSVPGRVGLCVTTLLTLATQAAGFSQLLPAVGYTKALDYWMSTCLAFLFGALIEFTIVNSYCRRVQKLNDIEGQLNVLECGTALSPSKSPTVDSRLIQSYRHTARQQALRLTSSGVQNGCSSQQQQQQDSGSDDHQNAAASSSSVDNKLHKSRIEVLRNRAKRIDRISRLLFPLSFFTFTACFSLYYGALIQ